MLRISLESGAMCTTGRKVKPSQKVLENYRIDTKLKALQETNTSTSFAVPLKPIRGPIPAPDSALSKPLIEPLPAPDSVPRSLEIESQVEPIFEVHCEPSRILPKSVVKKRPLAAVIADIPPLESVLFEPLDTGPECQP
jgi:hypothetical protein